MIAGTLLLLGLLMDEPADPLRPPAMQTESVPALPPDLVERIGQYQNARSAGFLGWCPDGNGILIATRFGNTSQIHRVYAPEGRREQITFLKEPARGRFLPVTNDQLLVVYDQGGNENNQIYRLDLKTGKFHLLTDGKSRNNLGPVRMDGSLAVFLSNERNGRDTDIYVIDPRTGSSKKMIFQTNGEFWGAADWTSNGNRLLVLHYVSANESYPAYLKLETPSREPVEPPELVRLPIPGDVKASFRNLAFSPDGKSIYLTSDFRGEFQELMRFDVGTGEYTTITGELSWDVDEIEVDPYSGRVAFITNEDGISRLYLLEGEVARPIAIPQGVLSGMEFSPDGKKLGFTLARADAPADVYSIDLETDDLTRWTFSEVGGLDPSRFVRPKVVRFPSFDGREIPAFVSIPPTASKAKPAPVLINIHGGPESQYRPSFSGISQFYLNEMGIAVIHPNVRGSSGYGKTYLTLDNAKLREDSVRDIGALLDWIATQPELDSRRVAVAGGSYGGYMVLASLVHFGERLRAGVDIVGIANFRTFLEQTSPYRQDLRRVEYGDERDPEMQEFFDRISPAKNADKIRSALLVAHGKNDPRVPFAEAEQIAQVVRASGRPVWTVFAENEGHGFAKKENSDYVANVIALFLRENLLTP